MRSPLAFSLCNVQGTTFSTRRSSAQGLAQTTSTGVSPTSVTNWDPHQLSCSIRRQHWATKALRQNVHGVLIHARTRFKTCSRTLTWCVAQFVWG